MEKNSERLTIENLNEAYIRLIKLFMEGGLPARTNQIAKFLNDPSPAQAFNILNQICPLKKQDKPQPYQIAQKEPVSFKLKKTFTQMAQETDIKEYPKLNGNEREAHSEGEIKINAIQLGELKSHSNSDKRNNNDWQMRQKSERLKNVMNRLVGVFGANQKKVDKYESISSSGKVEGGNEMDRNMRPVEISVGSFKKY